jgi:hypothetical protein
MTPVSEVAVYRVRWVPGSDSLLGICHCGAEYLSEDPVDAWSWLLAHPDGHEAAPREPGRSPVLEGARR